MRMRPLIVVLSAMIGSATFTEHAANACEPSQVPPHADLSELELPKAGVTVRYAAHVSQVLDSAHPDASELERAGVFIERALRSELLGKGRGHFLVDCDSGGSRDPQCTVLRDSEGQPEQLLSIPGLRFTFPGDGTIYAEGHINSMFNVHRKYEWKDGAFNEVPQPFLFVGLDSTALESFPLYLDAQFTQVIDRVQKGDTLSVLVNNHDDGYLIRTNDNVLGWAKIVPSGEHSSPIANLQYVGD